MCPEEGGRGLGLLFLNFLDPPPDSCVAVVVVFI